MNIQERPVSTISGRREDVGLIEMVASEPGSGVPFDRLAAKQIDRPAIAEPDDRSYGLQPWGLKKKPL